MKFTKASAITPHDTTEIVVDTRSNTSNDGIFIGVGGDGVFKLSGDSSTVTFKNLISGTIYPLSVLIVDTESTATDMVMLDSGSRHV
jgi:hypothetical protein